MDIDAWLRRLTRRNRRIAGALAAGGTTTEVARRFRLSAARISQLRGELRKDWQRFQHEEPATHANEVAA
jgi:hypothetical protein